MSAMPDTTEWADNPISPEQRLFVGVIVNAVMEASGKSRGNSTREGQIQIRESTRAWFRNGGSDFQTVCMLAGVDPRTTRVRVLAYLERLDADPAQATILRRSRTSEKSTSRARPRQFAADHRSNASAR